ncbi:MAG: DNA topoisomerase IB [Candidatus Daviesbacteria bacterium]|nr:DNA topoisomerase IB [Candidatus Daviesbacteria bacterium]
MNLQTDPILQKQLKKQALHFVSDSSPGFIRQNLGKTFKYYDLGGKTIKDKRTLKRIEKLVIPPAWDNVWICPSPSGHIQATGVDERNRKQYIYHHDWTLLRGQNKFSRVVSFGLSLPKIRQRVAYYLDSRDIDKRKILSAVVWLLEHTFIRIGNEEYSRENNSFGLTTLRNKHVKVRGSQVLFEFRGKSGVNHLIEVSNKKISQTIKKCIELPGYELFQFVDPEGERHVVDSSDVNLFLKDITSDDFSAKDFRTWGGTNISATNFYKLGEPKDKKTLKQNILQTVKKVSQHLANTTAVCKNYYIHPAIFETYQKNILVPHFAYYAKSKSKQKGLAWDEYALIKLLQTYQPAI